MTWLRRRNPLPSGTVAVGAGLLVNGATAYAFLAIAGRSLGAEAFEPLSVLWALIYLLGAGFFLPLEQEVSRALAHRWARGLGTGPLIRQAAGMGAVMAAIVVVAVLVVGPLLLDRLFDDQILVLVGLLAALVGYAAVHLARGTLAGLGRFPGYASYYVFENSLRLAACFVLVLAGVDTAGPYAVAVGVAPGVALFLALRGERDLVTPGPAASRSELAVAMGSLLLASLLAAFLLYAGVVAVRLLATEEQAGETSVFLAGLAVARIPVFLFQAVQAALLPRLSALAGAHRFEDFARQLGRLVVVVVAIGAAGVLGALALGPQVVSLFFGSEFSIDRSDITLLALSSAGFMLAVALGQALIALSGQSRIAVGWALGSLVFVAVTVVGEDLFHRVAVGMAAGSAAAAIAMALLGRSLLRESMRLAPAGASVVGRTEPAG